MQIKGLPMDFSVCQLCDTASIDMTKEYWFWGKTDEEMSLVCPTRDVPLQTIRREDGFRAFRIEGVLDFSLIGILAQISKLLADRKMGIFAISTYNTDYILVKSERYVEALNALKEAGWEVV